MEQLKEKLKQMSKKQKIIILSIIAIVIVAIILGVVLSSGSTTKGEAPKTIEDEIRSKVDARVIVEAVWTYSGTPTVNITTVDISNDGTTAKVYGKLSVRDNYGDTYTGKFSADVTINDGSVSVKDVDIDTPTRSRLGN